MRCEKARSARVGPLGPKDHAARTDVAGGVGQKREIASALERDGQGALVACTRACLPARLDLRSIREISFQAINVLIIDRLDAIDAKLTYAPPRGETTRTAGAAAAGAEARALASKAARSSCLTLGWLVCALRGRRRCECFSHAKSWSSLRPTTARTE